MRNNLKGGRFLCSDQWKSQFIIQVPSNMTLLGVLSWAGNCLLFYVPLVYIHPGTCMPLSTFLYPLNESSILSHFKRRFCTGCL